MPLPPTLIARRAPSPDLSPSPHLLRSELKTRVSSAMRSELEAIASAQFRKVSDIVREAVRFYLASKPGKTPKRPKA